MPISIRYRVLCEVSIQHAYFLHVGSLPFEALSPSLKNRALRNFRISDFLEIIPTAETSARLSGMNMRFKSGDQGFLIGVRIADAAGTDKPFLTPDPNLRLHFGIRVKDPLFFNYTSLPENPTLTSSKIYCFSNDNTDRNAGFLTQKLPGFLSARSYQAGELYTDSATPPNLYEAIRNTGPAGSPVAADWRRIPPDNFNAAANYHKDEVVLSQNVVYKALVENPGSNLSNIANWQNLGPLSHQYVSHLDKTALFPPQFQVDLSLAGISTGTVRITLKASGAVVLSVPFTFGATGPKTVALSMSGLEEGLYQLDVLNPGNNVLPAQSRTFMMSGQAVKQGWIGMISLGPSDGDQSWFDGAGALRSPVYALRFFNRATRWEYHFPKAQTIGSGAGVVAVPGKQDTLVTPDPIPLTRFASGVQLQADLPGTPGVNESVLLPLPDPQRIRQENSQWYSDVFLPNLSL